MNRDIKSYHGVGKIMDKKPLIVGSLCAVVLLVLGSLSNVVGVESPQGCGCADPPCWVELSGVMGNNNWYVSDVHVGFNGSFYEINYRIDGGSWQTYTAPFSLTTEGIHLFEWYCDDNMSNIGSIEIKIDKTKPLIEINWTWIKKPWRYYEFIYYATCSDGMSGMNRIEFYRPFDKLYLTIIGSGPYYNWSYFFPSVSVGGLIRNPEITDDYVKFYAVMVMIFGIGESSWACRTYAYDNAGNFGYFDIFDSHFPATIVPGIYLFQNVTLPNNYTGHIGRFFIKATFYNSIEV
jgi:hypothetical protein